jgi:hypothetical protein
MCCAPSTISQLHPTSTDFDDGSSITAVRQDVAGNDTATRDVPGITLNKIGAVPRSDRPLGLVNDCVAAKAKNSGAIRPVNRDRAFDRSGRQAVAPARGSEHIAADKIGQRGKCQRLSAIAHREFPGNADSIENVPGQDRDTDGLSAFLEHGIGTNDSVPNLNSILTLGRGLFDDGDGSLREYLTITFLRNLADDDVILEVQVASDITAWSTLGTAYVSATHNSDGTETVISRSTTPMASIPREFIRLRVRSQ